MYSRYKKENEFSYALGVYPTLELLKYQSQAILAVVLATGTADNMGVNDIISKCKELDIPYEFNNRQIHSLTDKGNVYALGIFKKYSNDILVNSNTVLLENPENAGNLGMIIRSMVGFKVDNLVLIKPAVDIFNPDVIRSSMGSVFKIKFAYFDDIDSYLMSTNNSCYAFVSNSSNYLNKTKLIQPYTLMFGSESSGLTARVYENCKLVTIPMSKDIDSYNLGVSVSIALYQSHIA